MNVTILLQLTLNGAFVWEFKNRDKSNMKKGLVLAVDQLQAYWCY